MSEPVRLVIWDLDDTFWQGTLSEGGIKEYIQAHHDTVVELARRGIVSSICSKNDFAETRSILQEKKLWDYFVFPSIDWSPKGARIAALIETVQLRPSTVLFLDDSPSNRAEALAAVPGLRVADESYISTMLQEPQLRGKSDIALVRLAQYKLLERRKADDIGPGDGGNTAFLRDCGITVTIETDIEGNLDRAVELINRTNQLNFTKVRLPDDPDLAKAELAKHVGQYFVQAGLVRVSDKYGDHGFCGFYSKHNDNNNNPGRLVHYCFSCRILGMGVERWLYEKLGKPPIQVNGDVVADLRDEKKVDWINRSLGAAASVGAVAGSDAIPEIRLRGGCDMAAMAHYCKLAGNVTCLESNYAKDSIFFVRKDFSSLLVNALDWNAQMQRDCLAVGFGEDDVRSDFLADAAPGSLLIYCGWADVYYPVHRHRKLDFRIPCPIQAADASDITRLAPGDIRARIEAKGLTAEARARMYRTLDVMRESYSFDGLLGKERILENMRRIFDNVPRGALLVVILPYELQLEAGVLGRRERARMYNEIVRSLAAGYDNVLPVDISEFVRNASDMEQGTDHFHRIVFYRLFQSIMTRTAPHLRNLGFQPEPPRKIG